MLCNNAIELTELKLFKDTLMKVCSLCRTPGPEDGSTPTTWKVVEKDLGTQLICPNCYINHKKEHKVRSKKDSKLTVVIKALSKKLNTLKR